MSGGPPAAKPTVFGLPPVPFTKLYHFATRLDLFLSILGSVSGLVAGAVLPLFTVIFGNGLDTFNSPTTAPDVIVSEVSRFALYFLFIAIGAGGLTFLQVLCTSLSAESQVSRMRAAYARSLLRLDFAWYDTHRTSDAVARLAESTISISAGLTKTATVCNYSSSLIAGIVIGFYTSWKVTLVVMACAPLFAVALGFVIVIAIGGEKKERQAYSRAGGTANEVLSLIRAVSAYGGEAHEAKRYDTSLAAARAAGIAQGRGIGTAVGVMVSTFYTMYGIACFAGAMFILDSRAADPTCIADPDPARGCFTGGQVITTFVAVLLGALSFGQIGPNVGIIAAARAAAADIFGVIDARPTVDIDDEDEALYRGTKPQGGGGSGLSLTFEDVTFAYPSRKEEPVLNGFALHLSEGERLGVVGTSGSGKSTLAMLTMRAYDLGDGVHGCGRGSVILDGVDVRKWHVPSLRRRIGLVQQEPILFGATLAENIAMGVPDVAPDAVAQADVEAAARKANAHDFILALPEGYNTMAGTSVSSTQLSGGQRQRVCIARAIIRNPQILLLDEATSALDTRSERVVQAALDEMTKTQAATSLVIAHRLSTLTKMDKIVVMERGSVIEAGTHAELAELEGGLFREMLKGQAIAGTTGDIEAEPEALEVADAVVAGDVTGTIAAANADPAESKAQVMSATKGDVAPGSWGAPAPSSGWQLSRVWKLQSPDSHWFPIGVLAAAGGGAISSLLAVVYGGAIVIFFSYDEDFVRREAVRYLRYFLYLAFGIFLSIIIRQAVFAIIGERLINRLRSASFGALMRLPAAFFDDPKHSVGSLTTRLSTDSTLVKGATGEALASVFEALGSALCGVIIAFSYSWRLALVLIPIYPLLIFGAVFEFRSNLGVESSANKKLEDASTMLSESVSAARLVAAYGLQPRVAASYSGALRQLSRKARRSLFVTAFGQSFQRFTLQCTYSLAFYVGGQFIQQGVLTFGQLINSFLAITISAEQMGRITSQSPDVAKARNAAAQIFAVIDAGAASPIDPLSDAGHTGTLKQGSAGGGGLRIEFRNVSFAYPSRPDVPILAKFDLVIEPGQYVGVVGQSGSGKSTLALLIGRAYDVDDGAVLVDGIDVREWNVRSLRAHLGLVQQEPALFADSIAYNIGYGARGAVKPEEGRGVQPMETGDDDGAAESIKDGSADAGDGASKSEPGSDGKASGTPKAKKRVSAKRSAKSQSATAVLAIQYPEPSQEVVAAATAANAAGFIGDFPDGFATFCGTRGSQLSGGQKQRVAIARALLRAPPVLLLDEATAALDSKSEGVVQAALDKVIEDGRKAQADAASASTGDTVPAPRTTVCIAHRLSTLGGADRIIVLERGQLVEDGTHESLMALPAGKYRALALAQAQGA